MSITMGDKVRKVPRRGCAPGGVLGQVTEDLDGDWGGRRLQAVLRAAGPGVPA